jgi:hypothetical protein
MALVTSPQSATLRYNFATQHLSGHQLGVHWQSWQYSHPERCSLPLYFYVPWWVVNQYSFLYYLVREWGPVPTTHFVTSPEINLWILREVRHPGFDGDSNPGPLHLQSVALTTRPRQLVLPLYNTYSIYQTCIICLDRRISCVHPTVFPFDNCGMTSKHKKLSTIW